MNSYFIGFGPSKIHYMRFGTGERLVFCFHGYGELASSFAVFEPYLGNEFTLIAIEAPFHGKTDWQGELLLKPSDLITVMKEIAGDNHQAWILFGYSMGGRMAMKIMELIPEQIEQLILVAPDGLHKNKWQWFTSNTYLGNQLFKYTMKNPSWILGSLKVTEQLNLMNMSIQKFIHYYLDDAQQRAELYKIWTTNRKFRPHLGRLKKLIAKHQVRMVLIFGKHDRIILTKRGTRFSQNLEHLITVKEIEAGHQLLQEKYAKTIAAFFVG
ncbi:MAG: alpha/beta hydrolase fold [Chitinophagaceae bacterium]|nr:MAG: alpha/beta hydrolase fold [Chitinophagaceae bacterium]